MTLPFKEDWATTDSAADHAAGHNDVATVLNDLFNHKNVLLGNEYIDPANTAAQNMTGWSNLTTAMTDGCCVLFHPGLYDFNNEIAIPGTLQGIRLLGLGGMGRDPNGTKAGVTFQLDKGSPGVNFLTYNSGGGAVKEGPIIEGINLTVKTPASQKELHTMLVIDNANNWRVRDLMVAYGAVGVELTQPGDDSGDNAYWKLSDFRIHSCLTAIDVNPLGASWSSGKICDGEITATDQLTSPNTRTGMSIGAGITLDHIKLHNYGTGYHFTTDAGGTLVARDLAYEVNIAGSSWTAYKIDSDEGTYQDLKSNASSSQTITIVDLTGSRNQFWGGDLIPTGFVAGTDTSVNDRGVDNVFLTRGHVANLGGYNIERTGNQGGRGVLSVAVGRNDGAITDAKFPLNVAAVAAQGTLTVAVQITDGDTMTLSSKDYTFQDTLTDADGNIQIGASLAATQQNIIDAINLTGTPGTQYATSMTIHPSISAATSWTTNQLVLTAKVAEAIGNERETTETFTSGSNLFDGDTLGATTKGQDPRPQIGTLILDDTNDRLYIKTAPVDGWKYATLT